MDSITVNSNKLEVRWYAPGSVPASPRGAGGAPTLVLLHEGLGCVEMWRDFPLKLARATGCGVFGYSRLGYGGSSPCTLPRPLDYMQEEGLRNLPLVLKAAGVGEFILVGHSDGGSIALVNAGGVQPPELKGVVTLAAHVFCEEVSVRSIAQARGEFVEGTLRKKLIRYHGDNVDCAFWGWNDAWLDPEFMKWNIEEYLPGIEVPVLAIQGAEDQYGTVAQVEAIGRATGAETLILEECGHSPHLARPEETLAAIGKFVATLP